MAADNGGNSNRYEEARKQRLDENKKRFEDLGITKSLSQLSTPEKKARQQLLKSKAANSELVEPRRSSRARTQISYTDDVDVDLSPTRKKARFISSSLSRYAERQLSEIKVATDEDRNRALRAAEEFQTSLQSGKPSFVKSMLRSHVYKGFWLGLASTFCKDHMPKKDLDMILEDEHGLTYDAKYLGYKNGLSGGWRGFALEHKLDDGDAVLFELVNPDKFKVYIFRVSPLASSETEVDVADEDGSTKAKITSEDQHKLHSGSSEKQTSKKKVSNNKTSKPQDKSATEVPSSDMKSVSENGGKDESAVNIEVEALKETEKKNKHVAKKNSKKENKVSNVETLKPQIEPATEVILTDVKSVEKNGAIEEKESASVNMEAESLQENGTQKRNVTKPRKKPAERLFRRRV